MHNHYQQTGGEDQVVRAEVALLRARGHETISYSLDNSAIDGMSDVQLARTTFWNGAVYHELRELFRRHAPVAAHFHNTFPLVSPAAYYAAQREGVPVVQTLHNFRLVCPSGLLFRDGRSCEDCLGKSLAWPGVLHACYRNSRPVTAAVAAMVAFHRARGTWANAVDVYIALSAFARQKFADGGLPADRIVVKPNFLADDPGVGAHRGGYALFVGRLAREKGVRVLLDAWARLRSPYTLKVVGSGPFDASTGPPVPGVEWLGQQPSARVLELMKDASFLLLPSECYENCPMTIVEAFATGLPVLASRLGSLAEMVRDHETGLHFRAGDPADLADRVEWAIANPAAMATMGRSARQEFDARYSADRHYERLREIYAFAARVRTDAVANAMPTRATGGQRVRLSGGDRA
ncbi:MAG TPA: glycosyltransferase family 4 protein [Gemmatirosa sp.]